MRRIADIVADINKTMSENADDDRDDGDGGPRGDSGLTLRFVSTHGGSIAFFHLKKRRGFNHLNRCVVAKEYRQKIDGRPS
jgi:hypothetical protein